MDLTPASSPKKMVCFAVLVIKHGVLENPRIILGFHSEMPFIRHFPTSYAFFGTEE
jgi:hypothetical protein